VDGLHRNHSRRGLSTILLVALAAAIIGIALFAYMKISASRSGQSLELTPEAKQYLSSLKLSDVEMKATESYLKQRIVEITGKIGNNGNRGIDHIEIYCVFYDAYGQVVLRQRVAIVRESAGGIKPGETKSFRLPFDDLPVSWNQQMPQLVIAGIRFSS